ncbi:MULTISPECIES: SPOR domain-containing protein [Methylomicrobium]|uniref:Sporulation related protein n=1 Tax=Methylomicrobium album BG8 TaxID=686340 RepID=H8GJL9_METAL|nr:MULTISPECIES: SPOR domain-containing protein [Methylomicrobium]EIC30379.1 sporulation related protein [Methylomicrobium album BG8]
MVEIDSETYQVKSMRGDDRAAPPRFLITQGRSQNLELLRHLIANTRQAVVLCGPEGVGKTGLLEVLQQRLQDELRWCSVKGHGGLTFEEIQERTGPLLRHQRAESAIKKDSPAFSSAAVLAVDDAGDISPGLVGRLIQYAETHPELRLLFVLTHDQWHIKHYTDPAIENCYLVEAKPFLQKECRDFIQHIASLTNSLRIGKEGADDITEAVYRDSHGIPARMLTHFPELNKPKESMDPLTVLVIAVVCLVSLALSTQWFTASRPIGEKKGATAQTGGRAAHFDFERPVVSLPVGNLLKYAASSDSAEPRKIDPPANDRKAGQIAGDSGPEPTAAFEADGPSGTAKRQDVLSENAQDAIPEPAVRVPVGDGGVWLAAQPENDYSLQLTVLSKASSMRATVARHAGLQPDLRIVRFLSKGKEKFVLLYGRFADAESAKNAKSALPAEFRAAIARKFGAIRKDFPSAKPSTQRVRQSINPGMHSE